MARHRRAVRTERLSADFRRSGLPRLAEIGDYNLHPERGGLEIRWRRPRLLANRVLPLDLVFRVEAAGGVCDPDEGMFERLSRFRSARTRLLREAGALLLETGYPPALWKATRTQALAGGWAALVLVSWVDRKERHYRPRIEAHVPGEHAGLLWIHLDPDSLTPLDAEVLAG